MSEIVIEEADEVGNRKTMHSRATLYRNGFLLIETTSRSRHPTEGLRGEVMVICVDAEGRSIYVSGNHLCTTCGGVFDPTTPSKRKDNFAENLPEPVGRLTQSLDIVHGSGPLKDWRDQLIRQLQDAAWVANELKPYVAALAAQL